MRGRRAPKVPIREAAVGITRSRGEHGEARLARHVVRPGIKDGNARAYRREVASVDRPDPDLAHSGVGPRAGAKLGLENSQLRRVFPGVVHFEAGR